MVFDVLLVPGPGVGTHLRVFAALRETLPGAIVRRIPPYCT